MNKISRAKSLAWCFVFFAISVSAAFAESSSYVTDRIIRPGSVVTEKSNFCSSVLLPLRWVFPNWVHFGELIAVIDPSDRPTLVGSLIGSVVGVKTVFPTPEFEDQGSRHHWPRIKNISKRLVFEEVTPIGDTVAAYTHKSSVAVRGTLVSFDEKKIVLSIGKAKLLIISLKETGTLVLVAYRPQSG